ADPEGPAARYPEALGRRQENPMFGLGAPELLIVLAVILVVFGGSQVPKLARNLGQAQKEFKKGLDEGGKADPAKADEAPKAD
ncbi:MAG: hypothetical protein RL531_1289, partial [Actinomycetota bacterium]